MEDGGRVVVSHLEREFIDSESFLCTHIMPRSPLAPPLCPPIISHLTSESPILFMPHMWWVGHEWRNIARNARSISCSSQFAPAHPARAVNICAGALEAVPPEGKFYRLRRCPRTSHAARTMGTPRGRESGWDSSGLPGDAKHCRGCAWMD